MLKLCEKKRGIVWNLNQQLEDLDYADDICLMSHKFSDMQSKINDLVDMAEKVGLEVNIDKTFAMRMNNVTGNNIQIHNLNITYVNNFCYLGCVMSTDNGVEDDIYNRLKKARSAFGRLNKIWRANQLSKKTKIRIFNSCVKSTLLYGCETWLMSKTIVQKLQVFVNKCLRIICGIFWPSTITNADLHNLLNEEPVQKQITRRKWRWIGHTLRKPNNSIARSALEWNPQGDRRKGRPKNTWRRTVLTEMKNINKTFYELKHICNDRLSWNNLVEVLCSQVE